MVNSQIDTAFKLTKKSGVNFGSALVCFPAMHIGDSITVPFNRGIGAKKAD